MEIPEQEYFEDLLQGKFSDEGVNVHVSNGAVEL